MEEKKSVFNEPDSAVTYASIDNNSIHGEKDYVFQKPDEDVNRVEIAREPLENDKYDEKYNDVSTWHHSGVKLTSTICEIIDHEDDISEMNLSRARLPGSGTKKKFLYTVDFSESDFFSNKKDPVSNRVKLSDFNKPTLTNTNLKKVYLVKTMLNYANLENANLAEANLQEAFLSKANLKNAFLMKTKFQKTDLSFASFENAILWGTNLQEASLEGTCFENAYILEANLDGVEMLTLEQLSKAKTLYKTRLKPELMEQVRISYPQLLGAPDLNDLADRLIKY